MSIINKGILNSGSAYLRQVGNDWPTAQVVTTTEVIEGTNQYFTNTRVLQAVEPKLTTANVLEVNNQYFTNTRVLDAIVGANLVVGNLISYTDIISYGNLIANGLIIRNIAVSDAVLSGNIAAGGFTGNTVVTDSVTANIWNNLYTANVVESDNNLYYTNARARTAYTAGTGIAISQGGVISYKQADPGLGFYNSGLTLASAIAVSNIYSNVVTFSSQDGVNFIVQSLHVTNLSPNVSYLNGRINHNYSSSSNSVIFANLLEIPGFSSQELFLKPSTFKVGDQIQLQSFSNPKQPANNLISAMVSYQGSQITEYDRAGISLTSNSMSNVFTAVGKSAILESVKVVNPNPTPATITVQIVTDLGASFAYLASNLLIPAFSTIEVCEYPKTLLTDYTLRAQKTIGYGQPLNIFTSSKYTTFFAATPDVSTIGEVAGANIITIDFQTLGQTNGTTFYYSLDGNVQPTDFVPAANTGSFVVTNDQGVISLQLASDTGFEGEERFTVQVRKASVTGTIVATTSNITIKDTGNTEYVLVSPAVNTPQNEGNTITFNVTVYNPTSSTYYYTTKNMAGNVFASRFSSANTGAFVITGHGQSNTVSLVANADGITNGDGIFQLEIRSGSTTGTIANTSSNVTIVDTSQFGLLATGGTVVTEGNFKIHIFTSSNTFIVSGLGGNSQIQYAVVAAGGAGGFLTGGGAGGLVQGKFDMTQANLGTYTIQVGAGGAAGGLPGGVGTPSFIQNASNTIHLSAMRGGGGGWASYNSPGGSGGGGSPTTATGIPGQGYPGYSSGTPNTAGGGGGAGGAATSGGAGPGAIVPVAVAVPASYGDTSGGQRYFAGGGGMHPGGAGGIGGGGKSGGPGAGSGFAGNVNTGGGGGGGTSDQPPSNWGGAGGSGVVIIKYRYQ